MNSKVIICILISVVIAVSIPVGAYLYILTGANHVAIDERLVDNKAAQEIAALGIKVSIEDLGTDGNGLTVNGQTRIYENGTVAEVVLDDSIDPNSYQAHAILYHELGHVIYPDTDEAGADSYAQSRGYEIHDAYAGLH